MRTEITKCKRIDKNIIYTIKQNETCYYTELFIFVSKIGIEEGSLASPA
jgi:hypothetical protein